MTFDFNIEFERMILEHDLDTVIILAHMNPDGDAAGSVMSLAHYIHMNELLKPFGGGGHKAAAGLRKETRSLSGFPRGS